MKCTTFSSRFLSDIRQFQTHLTSMLNAMQSSQTMLRVDIASLNKNSAFEF